MRFVIKSFPHRKLFYFHPVIQETSYTNMQLPSWQGGDAAQACAAGEGSTAAGEMQLSIRPPSCPNSSKRLAYVQNYRASRLIKNSQL